MVHNSELKSYAMHEANEIADGDSTYLAAIENKEVGGFVAGTLVHTDKGLVSIENIQVGDMVLSKPEGLFGKPLFKSVVKKFAYEDNPIWVVFAINTNTLKIDCLISAYNQRFWVDGIGWIPAEFVRPNNFLKYADEDSTCFVIKSEPLYKAIVNNEARVWMFVDRSVDAGVFIDINSSDPGAPYAKYFLESEQGSGSLPFDDGYIQAYEKHTAKVYDFEISQYNTYYVGDYGVLVSSSSGYESEPVNIKFHQSYEEGCECQQEERNNTVADCDADHDESNCCAVAEKRVGGFVAGTLVHTDKGLVSIEIIQPGDMVLSKPESDVGEISFKPILKIFKYTDKPLWAIFAINCKTESMECIISAYSHQFWVNESGWMAAEKICTGKYLGCIDAGDECFVLKSEPLYNSVVGDEVRAWMFVDRSVDEGVYIRFDANDPGEMYKKYFFSSNQTWGNLPGADDSVYKNETYKSTIFDLEVGDNGAYYVGVDGFFVHNKN
ncbi:pretoxin HINT domain-containing protein [Fluviicoccus keumensis]|uniref:Pretoxin HINT domain-containing protein n=1 Tax=Fluviicoccus keumensis TaxID=1435465 RepID=A0A4Q7Z9P1_9GAMM|nr:polymorphic toxin-type HINT domain-containing protein [Fluviicoccus keumensis]RZU47238.1 pretoxin HINT domain-containing protein [Fluviicoccus keumensis]